MRSLLLAAALLGLTSAAYAYDSCSEPDRPSCTNRYGPFDDEYDFDRCKRQVENFRTEVTGYVDCLKENSEEAISEFNDAVSGFNRRVNSD